METAVVWHEVAGIRLPVVESNNKQWIPLVELARSTGIKLARLEINCKRMRNAPLSHQMNGGLMIERAFLQSLLLYMRTDALTEPLKLAAAQLSGYVLDPKKAGRPPQIPPKTRAEIADHFKISQNVYATAKAFKVSRATVRAIAKGA